MLYHFAITPDAFEPSAIPPDSRASVVLVELLRGIAENGLLANLQDGEWHKSVRRLFDIPSFTPELRDRLRACLNVIDSRKRLIRHPPCPARSDADHFRWLHWAVERNSVARFQGVFSTEEYIELSEIRNAVFVAINSALDQDCWQKRPRSVRFPKTDVQLKVQLTPLLRYAEKVTLIDPYLSCRKQRFFDTVQCCADLLGRRDGKQQRGVIQIHAGNPFHDSEPNHGESALDRLKRWEQELAPVIAHWKHRFEISLWRNRQGEKTFHDRYIITDQCGVSAPGGLDFGDDPTRANLTTWTSLEPSDIDDIILKEFNRSTSPYELLASRTIK